MWNLHLVDKQVFSRNVLGNSCEKLCVDPVSGKLFIVNTTGIFIFSEVDGTVSCVVNWQNEELVLSKVVHCEVITSCNGLSVLTQSDALVVDLFTYKVGVVGSVTDGIEAASWCPAQELLVLVSATGKVILMTVNYEPVEEISLHSVEFGEKQFISAGWGKKQTQFHGSSGKNAAHAEDVPSSPVTVCDDHVPRISWKGDGELFAVSFVRSDSLCRQVKIISRTGILQYTSEDISGLEQPLSWKPSGDLIASSQRLAHKYNIVFLEKNGLQHGSFRMSLPDQLFVKELFWNPDSSVLLIWLTLPDGSSVLNDVIQLWTMRNYHWYLKQDMRIAEGILDVLWDPSVSLKVYILSSSCLYQLRWIVGVDISRGIELSDLSQAAVIDGNVLKLTAFCQGVIPPPLSAYEVSFPDVIFSVIYAPGSETKAGIGMENSVEDSGYLETLDPPGANSNSICVIHGRNSFTFLVQAFSFENLEDSICKINMTECGSSGLASQIKAHRVVAHHLLQSRDDASLVATDLCNWTWLSVHTMLASYVSETRSYLIIISLDCIGGENGYVRVQEMLPVEDIVVAIAPSHRGLSAAVQLRSGAVLKYCAVTETIEPWFHQNKSVVFPYISEKLELVTVDSVSVVPVGLSNQGRLYFGHSQLVSNCTSFHVHNDHLLMIQANHKLSIIPLKTFVLLSLSESEGKSSLIGCRNVEKGSKIVTALAGDASVILQMPRGNIEVISPRPLIIKLIKSLLSKHHFNQAVLLMRKHRINMNLLYDHNPKGFEENVRSLVRSIENPENLVLLITSLSEEDVTKTLYCCSYEQTSVRVCSHNSKVNHVCNILRSSMIEINEAKYFLPILSSYIKMSPSEIDVALMKVWSCYNNREERLFESGMKHLLYIVDSEELYNVALGTYNFDIVLMVAEQSQKDPKEYLPFLNHLNSLDESYRKFKIDVHLKRFRKALEHLKINQNDHTEEFLALIKKEKLYKEAMEILGPNHSLFIPTALVFGEYLRSSNYHEEAAIMFERAGRIDWALQSYEMTNCWQNTVRLMSKLSLTKEELHQKYITLASRLQDQENFHAAAVIYETCLQREEEAVECLAKGYLWDEAMRIAIRYSRVDLIESIIKDEVLGCYKDKLQCIMDAIDLLETQCTRLTLVRESKRKELLQQVEFAGETLVDQDLYSDASSMTGVSNKSLTSRSGSITSGRTHRSSKSRRKLERKKYSTKEGSTFEDLGLVMSLHGTIVSAEEMTRPVSSLLKSLVYFNCDSKAKELQEAMTKFLSIAESKKAIIWPDMHKSDNSHFGPQMSTDHILNTALGRSKDTDFIRLRMEELDPQFRYPPIITRKSDWMLKLL